MSPARGGNRAARAGDELAIDSVGCRRRPTSFFSSHPGPLRTPPLPPFRRYFALGSTMDPPNEDQGGAAPGQPAATTKRGRSPSPEESGSRGKKVRFGPHPDSDDDDVEERKSVPSDSDEDDGIAGQGRVGYTGAFKEAFDVAEDTTPTTAVAPMGLLLQDRKLHEDAAVPMEIVQQSGSFVQGIQVEQHQDQAACQEQPAEVAAPPVLEGSEGVDSGQPTPQVFPGESTAGAQDAAQQVGPPAGALAQGVAQGDITDDPDPIIITVDDFHPPRIGTEQSNMISKADTLEIFARRLHEGRAALSMTFRVGLDEIMAELMGMMGATLCPSVEELVAHNVTGDAVETCEAGNYIRNDKGELATVTNAVRNQIVLWKLVKPFLQRDRPVRKLMVMECAIREPPDDLCRAIEEDIVELTCDDWGMGASGIFKLAPFIGRAKRLRKLIITRNRGTADPRALQMLMNEVGRAPVLQWFILSAVGATGDGTPQHKLASIYLQGLAAAAGLRNLDLSSWNLHEIGMDPITRILGSLLDVEVVNFNDISANPNQVLELLGWMCDNVAKGCLRRLQELKLCRPDWASDTQYVTRAELDKIARQVHALVKVVPTLRVVELDANDRSLAYHELRVELEQRRGRLEMDRHSLSSFLSDASA